MISRLPLRTVVLAVFGALLAVAAVACTKDDTAKVADSVTTTSTSEDENVSADDELSGAADSTEATDSTSGDLMLPDAVDVSGVTCSDDGQGADETSGVAAAVDCGTAHINESVSITGANDIDDCFRAIATYSDVVIAVDEDGEFDIDDERVNGHAFSGYDGEYDCQITLAEARTEPLIDR